jgi:hypothetical protein
MNSIDCFTIHTFSSYYCARADSLPKPHHGPGPIQRPNKLTYPSKLLPSSMKPIQPFQSPVTPDVLDQINHFVYENSSGTSTANANHISSTSSTINDLTTANTSWTTFSSSEWSPKNERSWSLSPLQSPTLLLASHVQNPFAVMPTMNEHQQSTCRSNTTSNWSSTLGTTSPCYIPAGACTQSASTWSDLLSPMVPLSADSMKSTGNSWPKVWSVHDALGVDNGSLNGRVPEVQNLVCFSMKRIVRHR